MVSPATTVGYFHTGAIFSQHHQVLGRVWRQKPQAWPFWPPSLWACLCGLAPMARPWRHRLLGASIGPCFGQYPKAACLAGSCAQAKTPSLQHQVQQEHESLQGGYNMVKLLKFKACAEWPPIGACPGTICGSCFHFQFGIVIAHRHHFSQWPILSKALGSKAREGNCKAIGHHHLAAHFQTTGSTTGNAHAAAHLSPPQTAARGRTTRAPCPAQSLARRLEFGPPPPVTKGGRGGHQRG